MNRKKMTLEEFQELRARQQELLDEMQKLVSRDDFDLNFDRDTVTNLSLIHI